MRLGGQISNGFRCAIRLFLGCCMFLERFIHPLIWSLSWSRNRYEDDLNPVFSRFIKEFSEDMPFFYGLFSILFAIILGIAAAFIRRSISKFREKYFKKVVKQSK